MALLTERYQFDYTVYQRVHINCPYSNIDDPHVQDRVAHLGYQILFLTYCSIFLYQFLHFYFYIFVDLAADVDENYRY